jgi:hypothetical protein
VDDNQRIELLLPRLIDVDAVGDSVAFALVFLGGNDLTEDGAVGGAKRDPGGRFFTPAREDRARVQR